MGGLAGRVVPFIKHQKSVKNIFPKIWDKDVDTCAKYRGEIGS